MESQPQNPEFRINPETFIHEEMIWIILEHEQDILVLSIVYKFRKVPFEIT